MPAGASQKREHEYKELKQRFKKEHRYGGREEEVASRIVNKQRKKFGETKGEKKKDAQGKSPDRNLPIQGYQEMTISQVSKQLDGMKASDIRKLRTYESRHKNRKGMMQKFDKMLERH